jgi:hypothetical protein
LREPWKASAILKLHVGASTPKHRGVLDTFPEHPGVTDTAEIQRLDGIAYRSDLD